jgi:hypothetical protein
MLSSTRARAGSHGGYAGPAALRGRVPPRVRPAGGVGRPGGGRSRRPGGRPLCSVGLRRALQPQDGHARRSHLAPVPGHAGRPPAVSAKLTTYEAIDLARSVYPLPGAARLPPRAPRRSCTPRPPRSVPFPLWSCEERFGVPFLLTEHGVYYRERLLGPGAQPRPTAPTGYSCPTSMPPSSPWRTHCADLVAPVARFNAAPGRSASVSTPSQDPPHAERCRPRARFPLDAAGRQR